MEKENKEPKEKSYKQFEEDIFKDVKTMHEEIQKILYLLEDNKEEHEKILKKISEIWTYPDNKE